MSPTCRVVLALVALSLALLSITGCPRSSEDTAAVPPQPEAAGGVEGAPTAPAEGAPAASDIEIALISNTVSPFWTAVEAGLEKAAADLGCKAYMVGCKSGQLEEQRRLLESAEAKGVKGIAVSPLDTKALTPVIDEIVDRGTPVVAIDSDCPGSKRYCYVGSDNAAAGRLLADYAKKKLPEGAKCVLFVGEAGVENSQARINSFKEGVAEKKIEVLDVMQDHSVIGRARSNVEDVIQKHPDIDALVGIWSYNLPAIAAAVKESGKRDQILVIGFDAEPATLQSLEAGDIDGTVVQNPYGFGYKSVEILFHLASKNEDKLKELVPDNKIVDTGVELVTPENLGDFKAKLKERGIESS
ncbi:MAG: sugar-binding protein [Armatimonadetes bacterium]|nr:sugar-binding protein [Armatimonadota bacterium]MDI9586042.1 sugar-binding protein [Acidobacteriota bacterium]